jgi:CubicO group peptidase (beta-lactamase class C family)
MKKVSRVVLLVMFLIASASPAHGQMNDLESFAIEIEQLRNLLKIPGLSVAIVKSKRLLWARGFGYRDYENRLPATPETLYPIASLTKTFAATLVMQMVEQKRIRLDDLVSQYRADRDVAPGATIRHYLTHTSETEPGRYFFYSGARFGRLTTILEKASGKSFRALVAERSFQPAGMTQSVPGLGAEGYDQALGGLSHLYVLNNSQFVRTDYWKGITASSGAISTVLDLARYDIALRNNVFISGQTRAQMFTPGLSNSGKPLPYGLGWFIQDFDGRRVIWAYRKRWVASNQRSGGCATNHTSRPADCSSKTPSWKAPRSRSPNTVNGARGGQPTKRSTKIR